MFVMYLVFVLCKLMLIVYFKYINSVIQKNTGYLKTFVIYL